MSSIFDADAGCHFSGRKILFDTNVWIAIDGYNPGPKSKTYSNYYAEALKGGNTIVVNDYIIAEYFNRACKIQYDVEKQNNNTITSYKRFRTTEEFKPFLESVRDTCLNMIDDCHYESALCVPLNIQASIAEAGTGLIDFSDIVIREHCSAMGYVLVSDDADLSNCGLDFVTANTRVLREAGVK